ncbi:hypothetical protein LPW11_07315 [Geomonas sp. RF6]|uniref:hypothetical protein n=1 Tax=Geomonas sp. RF6 TaxID=2897342 RepID=UPI001E36850B|nr:hypothetical protein [Geomonas sp. RF6]UFS71993.1 hypothetical protein LPW11_07315 [Geomonas sp. RF6]
MAEKKGCGCGGGQSQESCGSGQNESSCGGCGGLDLDLFWCESCRRPVAEKRCPLCGQKARRARPSDGQ